MTIIKRGLARLHPFSIKIRLQLMLLLLFAIQLPMVMIINHYNYKIEKENQRLASQLYPQLNATDELIFRIDDLVVSALYSLTPDSSQIYLIQMESQFQLIDDQDPEISRLFELYRMALTQLSKNSRQHIDIPSDTVIRYNPGMESFFSLSGQINSRLMAHREEYNRQVALSHSQLAISVRFIERNIFLSYALFMVFVLVLFLSYTERLFSPINRLNHQLEAEGGLAYPLVFPRDSGSEIEKMASSLNRIKAVFFNRDDEKKKKIRHQQIKVEHMGNLISKMIICFDDQYRITYINEKGMSLLSGNGTTYIGQNLLIINSTLFESVITCLTEEIFKKPRQVSFSQGGKYLTLTMMIIPCIFSSYTEYILILDEESLLAEAPGVGADAALEA